MNLNGTWEFAFDREDKGLAEMWQVGPSLDGQITVPFAYQTALSGLGSKEVCEVVWYARSFELPSEWSGDRILLHFGAVDYEAEVWVNGTQIAWHVGGHVPFSADITRVLEPGPNRVVVRVADRQSPGQPRGKQACSGLPHGIDYYCTTGIWQTVWLEPVGKSYLADLVVRPSVEEAAFWVTSLLYGDRSDVTVRVQILDQGRVVAQAEGLEALRLDVSGPRLWSPDDPFLYDVEVEVLRRGELVDFVRSYAGMRSVEVRNGQFWLNGEPTFLKLVLDQGYWPDGFLTAPSDEALRADVEWCKALGFNGARKHQKIEDPRWLTWCDRLGLLVWGEMANARDWSFSTQQALESEWSEAVRRDRSHPCIVAWVPLNESMGFPRLRDGDVAQRNGLEALTHLTRELDPTRPIIDNDGWEQTPSTDIVAIHDYCHSGAVLAGRYVDTLACGVLPERIWLDSRPTFLPGGEVGSRPVMLTEVGGFLTRPTGVEALDVMYEIYGSVETGAELEAKYAELMEAIGTLGFVAGLCYTQLTDVEQELNGLLTYDRIPKVDPGRIAEIHRALDRVLGAVL